MVNVTYYGKAVFYCLYCHKGFYSVAQSTDECSVINWNDFTILPKSGLSCLLSNVTRQDDRQCHGSPDAVRTNKYWVCVPRKQRHRVYIAHTSCEQDSDTMLRLFAFYSRRFHFMLQVLFQLHHIRKFESVLKFALADDVVLLLTHGRCRGAGFCWGTLQYCRSIWYSDASTVKRRVGLRVADKHLLLLICSVETSSCILKLTLTPFSLCGHSATCTVLQRVKTHTYIRVIFV